MNAPVTFRPAAAGDAAVVHRLIADNVEAGHLLPRSVEDVRQHASRFLVGEVDGRVVACAELAPLSRGVAEVRSLVVAEAYRGRQIGPQLVIELAAAGASQGFSTLCAFTHEPSHFVRMGFTIVPHMWVPEKIAHDCTSCALFRRCGQYAVMRPLRSGVTVRPERPAAMVHPLRAAAPRRPTVERLRLRPVAEDEKPAEALTA